MIKSNPPYKALGLLILSLIIAHQIKPTPETTTTKLKNDFELNEITIGNSVELSGMIYQITRDYYILMNRQREEIRISRINVQNDNNLQVGETVTVIGNYNGYTLDNAEFQHFKGSEIDECTPHQIKEYAQEVYAYCGNSIIPIPKNLLPNNYREWGNKLVITFDTDFVSGEHKALSVKSLLDHN